jgi:DNA-binding transcriptional MerR regulator
MNAASDDDTVDGSGTRPAPPGRATLDPADAALVDALAVATDDLEAPFDLDELAAEVGTTRVLLEAVERAGLLLPHHVDDAGVPRFSQADAGAVRAGLALLEAGLPLAELLSIASSTDEAVRAIAEQAVEAFLRFVRDPVLGAAAGEAEAGRRLVTAYERMLPATERLVAHHLRRRLVAAALTRLAQDAQAEHELR